MLSRRNFQISYNLGLNDILKSFCHTIVEVEDAKHLKLKNIISAILLQLHQRGHLVMYVIGTLN